MSGDVEMEALAEHWCVFKVHHPADQYELVERSTCSKCGETWPCSTLRPLLAAEQDRAVTEALEDAATECWHGQDDFVGRWLRARAAALRAALPRRARGG